MSGSTIGGVVGGVIGFVVGGPVGAQIGWMIGAAVGGYIDPEVIKGPRQNDASVQTTTEGAPRPIVYGKAVVAGNVIQLGPRVEHEHRERSGKGGGPVQENYTYTRTFAVRICEGPISGIGRVWRNDKLVADFRNPSIPEDGLDAATWAAQINNLMTDTASFAARCTIYLGDETQEPDPTLEALGTEYGGGAGNVPAYRGTAYAVLIDEDVTSYDALPQYRWEVISNGVAGDNCTDVYEDAAWYFPLDEGGGTANELIQNLDGVYSGGGGSGALRAGSAGSFQMGSASNYMVADHLSAFRLGNTSDWTVAAWGRVDDTSDMHTLRNVATCTSDFFSGLDNWSFRLRGPNLLTPQFVIAKDGTNFMTLQAPFEVTEGEVFYLLATYEYDEGSAASGTWKFYVNGSLVDSEYSVGANRGGQYLTVGGYGSTNYGWKGTVSDVAAWHRAFTAQEVADTYYSFNYWKALPDVPGAFIRSDGTVSGLCNNAVSSNQVMVSDAILDLADRVGLDASQLDVSQLTSTVLRGLVIGRQMPCQEAMKVLQSGYFFDMPEWGDGGENGTKLRCILRGGASSFAITADDLVWSDEDEDTRAQVVEFPRKINLISPDPTKNYEPTKHTAERRTDDIKAVGETTVDLPITQTADERAQCVEKMHKIAWTEAEGRTQFQLPENFSGLVPSDTFTKDGKRWRATQVELADGVVKVEAVRDRASAYASNATGPVSSPSIPPSSVLGPTLFTAFNAPALWPADAGRTGMYVAARGHLAGWPGCYVELSVDGGTTFSRMATLNLPAILGELTAAASGAATTFSVSTPRATLDSVTGAQITSGLNRAAVVTSDTAEVFQFQTATDTGTDTYDLTTLTRAELGTTAASHAVADAFVFLDSSVMFIPISPDYAGQTVIWRPVTIGTTASSNETFSTVFNPGTIIVDGGVVT